MNQFKFAQALTKLDKHINKSCAYCLMSLGNEVSLKEFINHLVVVHDIKELIKIEKVILEKNG